MIVDEQGLEPLDAAPPGTLGIEATSEPGTIGGLSLTVGNQGYDISLQADQRTWIAEALPSQG